MTSASFFSVPYQASDKPLPGNSVTLPQVWASDQAMGEKTVMWNNKRTALIASRG